MGRIRPELQHTTVPQGDEIGHEINQLRSPCSVRLGGTKNAFLQEERELQCVGKHIYGMAGNDIRLPLWLSSPQPKPSLYARRAELSGLLWLWRQVQLFAGEHVH